MLREYSNILQLHTPTYLAFKYAPNGLARALQLFFIVTLIAGIGVLFGIPIQANRPVLADALGEAQVLVDTVSSSVEPFLNNSIPGVNVPPRLSATVGEASIAAGETINAILATFEAEAELLQPPLGTTASRIFRQFGRWISTPFAIMADYLGIALASMLVAKLLGGRATLSQHFNGRSARLGPAGAAAARAHPRHGRGDDPGHGGGHRRLRAADRPRSPGLGGNHPDQGPGPEP